MIKEFWKLIWLELPNKYHLNEHFRVGQSIYKVVLRIGYWHLGFKIYE